MYKSKKPYFYGTGRRKSSVARVHLFPNGTGSITINGRDIDDYFGLETLKLLVRQPLVTTEQLGKVDIVATVTGGGVTGQAGAIRHGVARALLLANEDNLETALAFRSPSGDGVKWFVNLPVGQTKPDGTPFTYGEYFTILSNYIRRAYGYEADPSGKDICRACFLPYDPDAFLNPFFIEDDFDYDISRFHNESAE